MKLACDEFGDPQGAPVVLLHAFPMSAEMWRPQRDALKNFRAVAPNFRGFGGTPLSAPWFIENAVDDVFETLDALEIKSAAFAGLSMGGYVAMRAAQKFPQRVARLILCDTRAEADTNEAKLKRAGGVELVRAKGSAAFVETFLRDALSPQTQAGGREAADFLKKTASAASPEAIMSALAALAARLDMTEALSKISVPTLIMVGARDKITPLPLSEAMRARIPGAQLSVIEGAGHFSNAENPAAFNERLLKFLTD